MVSSLISSIRGGIESVGPDWVDVAVGGITLRLSVPGSTAERMVRLSGEVRLFTSLQVRDDSLSLYGFWTEEERLAFEVLIGISGVGPRVALSVLSRFTPSELAAAVSAGDADAFTAVPGVGKRTASRILLELKGKLEGDWAVPGRGGGRAGPGDRGAHGAGLLCGGGEGGGRGSPSGRLALPGGETQGGSGEDAERLTRGDQRAAQSPP